MNERPLSLNDVLPMWWFITWRTALSLFGLGIIVALLVAGLGLSSFVEDILDTAVTIGAIILQLYFISKAINRDYPSRGLRIQAIDVSNTSQNTQPAAADQQP